MSEAKYHKGMDGGKGSIRSQFKHPINLCTQGHKITDFLIRKWEDKTIKILAEGVS